MASPRQLRTPFDAASQGPGRYIAAAREVVLKRCSFPQFFMGRALVVPRGDMVMWWLDAFDRHRTWCHARSAKIVVIESTAIYLRLLRTLRSASNVLVRCNGIAASYADSVLAQPVTSLMIEANIGSLNKLLRKARSCPRLEISFLRTSSRRRDSQTAAHSSASLQKIASSPS